MRKFLVMGNCDRGGSMVGISGHRSVGVGLGNNVGVVVSHNWGSLVNTYIRGVAAS